jgi:hypothetical protein
VPSAAVPSGAVQSHDAAQGSMMVGGWFSNTAFHLPGPAVVTVISAAAVAYTVFYLESRVWHHREGSLFDDKSDITSAAIACVITLVIVGVITSYLRWGSKTWLWQWNIDLLDSLTDRSFDMDIANNISIGFAWSFVCPPIAFACLIYALVTKDILVLAQGEFSSELDFKRSHEEQGGGIAAGAPGVGTPLRMSPSSLLVGMIPSLLFIYVHLFMTYKKSVVIVGPIVFAVVAVFAVTVWCVSCRTSSLRDAPINIDEEDGRE